MKAPVLPLLLLPACITLELPVIDAGTTSGPAPDLGTPGPPWVDLGAPGGSDEPGDPTGPASTSGPDPSPTSGADDPGAGTDGERPPGPPLALRITEVLPDPDGKDGGPDSPEYVELLNTGIIDADLDRLVVRALSWPVVDAGTLGLAGETLAPGAVLVIERYAEAADVSPPRPGGGGLITSFSGGSGLRNGDGAVGVEDGTGAWADVVAYGLAPTAPYDDAEHWNGTPTDVPSAGQALCRAEPGTDTDQAGDWAVCPPSPGNADPLPPPPPPADATLVITEVLANPPGPSSDEKTLEFVEVLNLGPDPIDLGTFTVADDLAEGAPGTDPLAHLAGDGGCGTTPTCLAVGARAILVGNAYTGPSNGALVLTTDDTTLADAGLGTVEPVVLRDGEGAVRSTYRAWPDPTADPNPASVEQAVVRADPMAPDEPASWAFADPTPGTP